MNLYNKSLVTDQSRTLLELCSLTHCPQCSGWLRPTWWSRGRFQADLVKVCEECLVYFMVKLSHIIEEAPMAGE